VTCRPFRLLLIALLLALASCSRGNASRTPPPNGPAAGAAHPAPQAPAGSQLATIRQPTPRCAVRADAPPQLAVTRAGFELERGEHERALACAELALRSAPRLVAALHQRAAALVALGHIEDARLAYAQALAVDPDDPETLYGAADLYVSRLAGDRASLELGLEYALRGARRAQRAPRRDRELAGGLLVLAAMAENDLGDPRAALVHARQALALGADEADCRYEAGVALYDLCRFAEARQALERAVALQPEDAWALHYLGRVAERTGDPVRAEALEQRARSLAPDDFPAPVEVDAVAFEREVRSAVASLPAAERSALADVPVEVADVPDLEDLTAVDPPLSPSILGLFRGPSERERCTPADGPHCRSIVVYRRNLARFARSPQELREQVKVTLLHELGHLHGESEEDLRARGLE
jgi:predicted Zn-dependent protease with MMP-like domain